MMTLKRTLLCAVMLCMITLSALCMTITTADAQGGVESFIEGQIRVQILSDSIVRIEKKAENSFMDEPTYHVPDRSVFTGANATSEDNAEYKIIFTDKFKVMIPKNTTTLTGISIEERNSRTVIWSYSTLPSNNIDLPAPADTPDVYALADSPRITVPAHGYSNKQNDNADPLNGYVIDEDAHDVYVMLPFGDARRLRSDFVSIAGSSELMPLSALGAWDSRFFEYDQDSATQQILDYEYYDMPLDNMVIDTDWRDLTAGYGVGYDINTNLFPDISEFFDFARDRNISTMFNDHPEPQRDGDRRMNVFEPEEVHYREYNLTKIMDLGLDYWWYDRNWGVALVSPTEKINKETLGMYLYSDITRQYYKQQAAQNGDAYARRTVIMGNADGIDNGVFNGGRDMSSHRYSFQWTGDIGCTNEILLKEVENMTKGGQIMANPYISADIGGHYGTPTLNTYKRWVQYGTLSPIYRLHCVKEVEKYRMPWEFGEEAVEMARNYADLRYRLLPLYYSLAYENYKTGMPIMRTLDFDYPQYEQARAYDQYLLGSDILIAPLTEKNIIVPKEWFSNLTATYFNNTTLTGAPVGSESVDNIDFDWDYWTLAHEGLGYDNFSIRYEGKITPEIDCTLTMISDDGTRIYVKKEGESGRGELVSDNWRPLNGEMYNVTTLTGGETYEIEVEYMEGSGEAKIHLFYEARNAKSTREVFIPDGEWMNVFTAQKYVGPKTITAMHDTNSSPIYVRMGSIIPLAQTMKNTAEKDWSTLTLDVYPSKTHQGSGTLYEDDTTTVAYKDGKFRTTDYSIKYSESEKAIIIDLDKAKGSFEGNRAFTNRTYNLRFHMNDGFSGVKRVTLNGNLLFGAKQILQDDDSFAFVNSGAAIDSNIYEVSFTANVNNASQIKIHFSDAPQTTTPPDTKGCGSIANIDNGFNYLALAFIVVSGGLVIFRKKRLVV